MATAHRIEWHRLATIEHDGIFSEEKPEKI